MNDLFEIVHGRLNGQRSGDEYHADCPWCGKEATAGATHFSYSERGGYCFVCGNGGSLWKLAQQCEALPVADVKPQRAEPKRKVAYWQASAVSLLASYEAHPQRVEMWQRYKPLSSKTIERMRLGVGVLPQSKCKHERLIVPVMRDGAPVWFRGREIDCNCGKWLASGGVKLDDIPLYNIEAVGTSSIVWIVENPIDALLLTERTKYVGVATYSVSYWRESWANALRERQPAWIIVAYDNDIPGNGGGLNHATFAELWRKAHNGKLLEPNGPKLANRLIGAGLRARLFEWPKTAPMKADIGSMFA